MSTGHPTALTASASPPFRPPRRLSTCRNSSTGSATRPPPGATIRCFWSGSSCWTCWSSTRSRTATGGSARLIANALLDEGGYGVGRWVSLEQLVAERPDEYYASLLASTDGWHDDRSDPWPWLTFFAGTVQSAYERFSAHVTSTRTAVVPKQQQVRDYLLAAAPPVFTMADIRLALPGVSDQTIRLVLTALKREGRAQSEGTGRSAAWRRLDG